jgi:transcriptional regulator with XRE-family HTH domain
MNIGKSIKELRKKKNLSQKDLAKNANITQAALSKIENGKRPGIETLKKISSVLGVSEPLIHIMSIEEIDIPEKNRQLYGELFPVIKDLIIKISV